MTKPERFLSFGIYGEFQEELKIRIEGPSKKHKIYVLDGEALSNSNDERLIDWWQGPGHYHVVVTTPETTVQRTLEISGDEIWVGLRLESVDDEQLKNIMVHRTLKSPDKFKVEGCVIGSSDYNESDRNFSHWKSHALGIPRYQFRVKCTFINETELGTRVHWLPHLERSVGDNWEPVHFNIFSCVPSGVHLNMGAGRFIPGRETSTERFTSCEKESPLPGQYRIKFYWSYHLFDMMEESSKTVDWLYSSDGEWITYQLETEAVLTVQDDPPKK